MRPLLPLLAAPVALLLCACGGYEAAQKAYNLGEYSKAAGLFDDAQRAEKNNGRKAEEFFLLGECYRNLGQVSKAATAYQRAYRLKYDDDIVMLRLADCYRAIGRFDDATEIYNAYYDRHKTDRRASTGMASVSLAEGVWPELSKIKEEAEKADSGYVVKPFREINSKYSDFCPVYVGEGFDVVYFSSMRMEKKKRRTNKITGQGGSCLYMSKVDGRGKWTVPQPLGEPFGGSGNDDGVASVSSDGRTMVFTRCPVNNQDGSPVHAYEVKREGGRWSTPQRILPGSDSTLMVAHPALSPDGQTLYFVSDCVKGSLGGLDLWKSLRNVDGSWGPAQNLGPMINTAGDEVFPSVRQDGTLYFSSDGRKGFGGLDIYKAVTDDDGRVQVTNLGLPINSAGDDFGITFVGLAEEGLFSSNRGNSKGYDDIYSFYLPPVILTIEAHIGESGKKAFADGSSKPKSKILRLSSVAKPATDNPLDASSSSADDFADKSLAAVTLQKSSPSPGALVPVPSGAQGEAKPAESAPSRQSAKSTTTKKSTTTSKKSTTTSKKSTSKKKSSKKSTSKSSSSSKSATAKTSVSKSSTTKQQASASSTSEKSTTSATTKSYAKSSTKPSAQPSSSKRQTASTSRKSAAKRKFVPIPDAYVRIVGSDGTNVKLPVDANGKVTFVAEKDVRYVILSAAPGHANARAELSTEGANKSQTIKLTSLLDRIDM